MKPFTKFGWWWVRVFGVCFGPVDDYRAAYRLGKRKMKVLESK